MALALTGAALTGAAGSAHAEPESRFFFSGDGLLRLYHAHFGVEREFRFRRDDGSYDPEALAALRHFFRSRTDHEEGPLSLRLVEMLDYVEDRFRPRRLTLYSAYRSPAFNAQLPGAARASLHTQGLAADVGLEGQAVRAVWEALRGLGTGGVGLYPGGEVLHLDAGPARFWAATTSRVGEDLSAGNARAFARTEFDRYATLEGARIALHSVTAFPLGLRRRVGPTFELVGLDSHITGDADCLWIREAAAEHRFRVRGLTPSDAGGFARATRLALETCEPRVGRTRERIETNRVEVRSLPNAPR